MDEQAKKQCMFYATSDAKIQCFVKYLLALRREVVLGNINKAPGRLKTANAA